MGVPNGCLWVYDEKSGQPRFVMGVDFAEEDGRMSVYTWIDENGEIVNKMVRQSVAPNILIVLDERYVD